MKQQLLLTVRRKGETVTEVTAEADPADTKKLHKLLSDAVARDGKNRDRIGEYEMDIRPATDRSKLIQKFVSLGDD